MTVRRRAVWWSVLAGLAILSGCGGDDQGGDASSSSAADGAEGSEGAGAVFQTADEPVEDREVIYTADLVVRVPSVPEATAEATSAAEEAGGFLFEQRATPTETTLTLKVPADRFDPFLDTIAALGRELRHDVQAQDVTDEVVDAEGRLETAQASADRLRSLLAEAQSTSDLIVVEGELATREAEIESLQGRLRVLNDQVALSTVTVRFTERDELQVSDDLPGFLDGLRTGWVALVNIAMAILVVVGFLLPFVPLLILAAWLVRRYRRRRPPRPSRPPGWPPTYPGPPPQAHPGPPPTHPDPPPTQAHPGPTHPDPGQPGMRTDPPAAS